MYVYISIYLYIHIFIYICICICKCMSVCITYIIIIFLFSVLGKLCAVDLFLLGSCLTDIGLLFRDFSSVALN